MENALTELVCNVGFPIVVSLFLLVRLDKTIGKFDDTMKKLIDKIDEERKFK